MGLDLLFERFGKMTIKKEFDQDQRQNSEFNLPHSHSLFSFPHSHSLFLSPSLSLSLSIHLSPELSLLSPNTH